MFTEDAAIFSPYAAPARGRAAIEHLHREWTGYGGSGKRLTVLEAGRDGDLASCLAAYSEGDETGDGTSLNILERQPNGRWLIRVSSLCSDDPLLPGTEDGGQTCTRPNERSRRI